MNCGFNCGSPRKEHYSEEKGRKYYFCSFCKKSIKKHQNTQIAKINDKLFYFCGQKDYEEWLKIPNLFNAPYVNFNYQ
jgi:YHS domain-containing protein